MRKSLVITISTLFTILACTNKNSKDNHGHQHNADGSHPNTHVHEDGSVHADHDEEVTQESFRVDQDSIYTDTIDNHEDSHHHETHSDHNNSDLKHKH